VYCHRRGYRVRREGTRERGGEKGEHGTGQREESWWLM
jgi:hypothetical protein